MRALALEASIIKVRELSTLFLTSGQHNLSVLFIYSSWLEKHKSYHIKDEQLARDGFKKFMKNEACQFDSCRFSRVCNHIHCIREDCTYVLHSSGQLYSHKPIVSILF
jgi:hypothetical protein